MSMIEITAGAPEGRYRFTKVRRPDRRVEWNAYDTQMGVYIEHAATKAEARRRIRAEAETYEGLAR